MQGSVCSLSCLSIAVQQTTLPTDSCYCTTSGAKSLGTPSQGTFGSKFLRSSSMFLARTVVSSEGSARKEEMCPSWFV